MTAKMNDAELAKAVRTAFAEEATELLRGVERALNALADDSGAQVGPICLDILRNLHTLKGSAAAAGVEVVKRETHDFEEVIKKVREAAGKPPKAEMDGLFQTIERLEAYVQRAVAGVLGELPEQAARPANHDAEQVPTVSLASATSEPAEAGSGKAPPMVEVEAVAAAMPEPPPQRQAPVRAAPAQQEEPGQQEMAEALLAARLSAGDWLRIRPERIESLHVLVGDLVMARLRNESLTRRLVDVRSRLEEGLERWREVCRNLDGIRRTVPEKQRNPLWAARAELNAALSGVFQDLSGVTREAPLVSAQAATISGSIEEGIRELRLMPLQPFFEEYSRVVRDAARSTGKEARLRIVGGAAEVDRAVLGRLKDPLLHMVKNAVVHGLESPRQRELDGKDRVGTITLEARCEGGRVQISIGDDGSGVDVEQVRARAVELGLWDPRKALPQERVLDLITQPGFSTREEADGDAGRGIGLDVVSSTVRELDGSLHLDIKEGRGTTFTLDVPISTSTNLGLLVRAGGQSYALLLNQVERALRIGDEDVSTLEGRSVVRVGDKPIAIAELEQLLGRQGKSAFQERRPAVVVRQGEQHLVLLVDEIPGEQALVVKSLPPAFVGASLLLGGALQPDGSVLPVLRVAALFERAIGRSVVKAAEPQARTSASAASQGSGTIRRRKVPRVLVADDSITMRTLIRNVLSGVGCEVTVAHDGQAAFEEFERSEGLDLVITDLQMPRMDGVGLCRAIRSSGKPQVPVVMVTSIGAAEEKQKALAAGADAYIVKKDFEQTTFVDLVKGLMGSGGFGHQTALG